MKTTNYSIIRFASLLASMAVLTLGLAACANSKTATADSTNTTKAAANASMGVVNARCPMRPDCETPPTVVNEWNGKQVGFCCKGCIASWNKLDDATKAERLSKVVR